MKTVRTAAEIRRALEPCRAGSTIGLVPTMGAFHPGHVALFETARRECDVIVASLFVNPAQFGDPADLAAYPRDEVRDAEIAGDAGVDFLFTPSVEEMYPPGYATWVEVEGAAKGLEGEQRPGHFRGVATVCVKLFAMVAPRIAFFGAKDAQQVAVMKQVVRDLNLDLDLRVVSTIRDTDGLALSSRNVRLSPEERLQARAIPLALQAARSAHRAGRDPIAAARARLAGMQVDYVAVADLLGGPTLAIAARVGRTRLIDNIRLDLDGEPHAELGATGGTDRAEESTDD